MQQSCSSSPRPCHNTVSLLLIGTRHQRVTAQTKGDMTKCQERTRTRLWSAQFSQINGPQRASVQSSGEFRLHLDSHEHESPVMVSPRWL